MSTPYYQDENMTIYHGDCREIMPELDFDVIVSDPPYGTESSEGNPQGGYGRRQNRTVKGFTIANDVGTETRDAMLSMVTGLPICLFGSPRQPDPPMPIVDRLVWNKTRPGMNGGPWRYMHETIYVTEGFVRVDDSATSVITEFPTASEHLHAKPIGLMLRLVAAAPPGVILDPFMGSGTTLRAAKDLGRQAIGIELDEKYCEMAADRMAQEVLDLWA
jgi:DNA modification methylase